MPFTTPLALLGLLFIPAVVAMYLLKLRRDETVVPSTLLWPRLVADVEANAPWQKLRRSLLLLLQLLLVVILALLAARPFLERPAGLARDIVLVVDTSASMAATDVAPNRLEAAKAAAHRRAARPADRRQGQRHRRRPDAPGSWSTRRPTWGASARRSTASSRRAPRRPRRRAGARRQARGALGRRPDPRRDRRRARDAGRRSTVDAPDHGPAASGASARTRRSSRWPSGPRRRRSPARSSSASRTSTSSAPSGGSRSGATARLIEVRDLLLDAQARSDVVIDDVPRDVGTLEVRLVGAGPDGRRARPDQLAVDDRAWAIVPPDRTRLILVVGDGRPVPRDGAELPPERRAVRRHARPSTAGRPSARTAGRGTSIIFEGDAARRRCRRAPILAIAPPATSAARRGRPAR